MFKHIILGLMITLFMNQSSFGLGNPSIVKIKLYKMAVSTSQLCTNPITVYTSENPSYTDMVAGPEFGSASLADGTYPCVILEMSDTVKFEPAATSGSCTAATEYSIEICRADNGGAPFQLVNGTTGTCASGEQRIAIYLSTGSTGANNSNSFMPPTTVGDTALGLNLASSLVVAGTKIGTFVVDFTNKVDGTQPTCGLDAPVFSFR